MDEWMAWMNVSQLQYSSQSAQTDSENLDRIPVQLQQ